MNQPDPEQIQAELTKAVIKSVAGGFSWNQAEGAGLQAIMALDASGTARKTVQLANSMNTIGNALGAFHQDSKASGLFVKPLTQARNAFNLIKVFKDYFPKKDTKVKSTKTLQQNPQDQFDDIGTSIIEAQKAASIGVAETLGGSFKEGLKDLGTTISTDVKGGISGVRDAHRDYFELRDNNITSAIIDVQDSVTGWAIQAGKTMLGGGKDVADTTIGAISNLTDTVREGNQDIQDTLNNNLQGSPPYLRTLAESQKPAARKKALLDEMNTETEGNIKQIRKKRFRLIREYKELYFKPLAKEIVKAQAGGIFKKAFSVATIAYELNWKKNVMAELTSIRRAVGGSKIDAWAKEKDLLASMPIIGNLFKKKPVEIQSTQEQTTEEGETTTNTDTTVKMNDGRIKVYDTESTGGTTIETHAKDTLVAGTNIFGGLKGSIENLASTMSESITNTLGDIPLQIELGMIEVQDTLGDIPLQMELGMLEVVDKFKFWTDSMLDILPEEISVGILNIHDKISSNFETLTTQIGSTLIDVQDMVTDSYTNLQYYTQNPTDILPDLETKWNDMLGPKQVNYHQILEMAEFEVTKLTKELKTPMTNLTEAEIEAKENTFLLMSTFIEESDKNQKELTKHQNQTRKFQNEIKRENKEVQKQQKIVNRYEGKKLEELTELQREEHKTALKLKSNAEMNVVVAQQALEIHQKDKDGGNREENLEAARNAGATQELLEAIAKNTGEKRKLEVAEKKGGFLGMLKKYIPGFSSFSSLITILSTIGLSIGSILAPAMGLLKTGGVFFKFAKLFSVIGLVTLMIKPLYDSLKVFQETEGSFGDKLKAAGWEFIDSIVGMVTGMLGTVASAFGLDGLAKMFKDIEKDGIRAPIEKFFSEGIGLQIKNTLTPVFEVLKKGFDMIFGPIQKFLGPGGAGEGLGKGLQDVLAIVKVGFGAFMSVFDSIMYALEPAIDILKKHIKFMGDIFMMALPTIKGIAGMFMNVAKIVLPLLMGIGVVMFKVMSPIIRLILKSFGVLQDILYPLIKGLFWSVNQVIQGITGIINSFLELFDFTSIDKALASIINSIPIFLLGIPGLLGQAIIKGVLKGIAHITGNEALAEFAADFSIGGLIVKAIRGLGFGFLIDNVAKDIGEIPKIIGDELGTILTGIIRFVPELTTQLILFFTEFPGKILQRAQQVIGRILDTEILNNIIPRVKQIGTAVLKPLDLLSDMIGKIPFFGKSFKGALSGTLSGMRSVGSFIETTHELGKSPIIDAWSETFSSTNINKHTEAISGIFTKGKTGFENFANVFSAKGPNTLFGRLGQFTHNAIKAAEDLAHGAGIKNAIKNFSAMNNLFGDTAKISKNANQLADGFSFMRPIAGLLQTIGDFITSAFSKLDQLGTWFSKVNPAKLFDFLIPLKLAISNSTGFMKIIFGAFTAIGDVLGALMVPITKVLGSPALKTALQANPLGFIFTAIDSVIQGVTGFIKGFKEGGIIGGIQGMLEGVFMALIGDMVDLIVKLPTKAIGWIIGLFPGGDTIKDQLFAFADAFSIKKILKPLFDIKDHLASLWEGFKVGGPIEAINNLIRSVLDGFANGIGALMDSILGVFGIEFGEEGFVKFIKPVTDAISGLITLVIDSAKAVPQFIFHTITGFITGFMEGFKTDGLVGGIKEGINGMIAAPIKLVESFINRIASLFGLGKVDFSSTIEKIQNSVQAILHYPLEIFSKVGDKFTAFFDYVWDNIIPPWMKNIITTVTDPIKELAEWIPNAFARIVQFAKDNLDPRKLAGKLKFWGKDKEEGPEPLKKEGTEKEKSWDSKLDKKTKSNLNKRLKLINEIGEMELDSKQRQKKIQKLKVLNDDLGFDLQKLHHKQLNEEQQNLVTKLAHHHEEKRLREEAERVLAEVNKGDDPLKALKDQLSAPDLTGMSTVVKMDPEMIDANHTRREQLGEVISQLERIYTCLYNMEGPIKNLDKNKVAESIKEIAETSTTAKEAQEKSEPIVAEVKKAIQAEADATMDFSDLWSTTETEPVRVKISDEIKDDKLEAHQKQIADRTAALAIGQAQKEAWQRQHALNVEAAEKRKTEILASTQIKDEVLQKELKELNLTLSAGETKAETEDSLTAGFEGLTRSQNTKELVSAIENLEESKEDKQEAKRDGITAIKEFDKTLANAPIMNDPVMPDFNEGWEPTWSNNLGNTIEKIKNNPYLNKGLDALEGTKLGEWLGKQQEGFGHTMASSGVNLVQAFQDGGKEGLYRAGTDMIAPHTVVGKLLTNSKDTETKVGKAASMLSAFKQGGKEGFLANVVGQATEVKPGEDKKWWQAGLQFAQSTGALDKATGDGGIGQAKKLWDTGLNFFNRDEKQIDDSEKTGDGGIGQAKKLWDTGLNFFNRGEKQIDDSEKTGVTAKNIGSKLKGFILGKVGGKTEAPPAEGTVDQILNKDGGVISGIQDKVSGKVSAITEKFSGIKDFFSKIKEWFSSGILKVFEAIGNVMKTVGKGIASFLKGVGEGIANFVKAIAKAAPSLMGAVPVLAVITLAIMGLGVALRIAAPAFEAFANIIKAFGTAIAVIIGALAQGIKTVLGGIGEFLKILASFKVTQMLKIVAFIFALGPAFIALGVSLTAFGLASLIALPAMTRLGKILTAVAKITEGGKISQKFNAVGAGMLKMSVDIKKAAKELKGGETKKAIKVINEIMNSFGGGQKKGGLWPFSKKKSSMPKTFKIPSIKMGSITAASLHLQSAIVAPIGPEQEKKLMDQETLGRVHLSDSTLSTLKNYTMAYVWDPLKRIALATESLLLPIEQLAYPSAPVVVPPTALNMDYGTPQTATQLETARIEKETAQMELRTMSHMEGSSQTAINAPTANVQNNTTYQSVKPTVRDDKRMRTMSIVGS